MFLVKCLPVRIAHSCSSLAARSVSRECKIPKPRPVEKLQLQNTVYVVVRARGVQSPTVVFSSRDYFRLVPTFDDYGISHAFPSRAEARVYCLDLGIDFPSEQWWQWLRSGPWSRGNLFRMCCVLPNLCNSSTKYSTKNCTTKTAHFGLSFPQCTLPFVFQLMQALSSCAACRNREGSQEVNPDKQTLMHRQTLMDLARCMIVFFSPSTKCARLTAGILIAKLHCQGPLILGY